MRASIALFVVLMSGLVLGTSGTAGAHPRCHHRCSTRVVREFEEPVVYERPVVHYVHGRCYHPTPYCSQPVVFKRSHWDGPWYYVNDRHDYREPVRYERHEGGYCRGGSCRHH